MMELSSPAFEPGAPIPPLYTCDGQDISPPLRWTEPPKDTRSFAVIADDPDAPRGTWVHWVMWNIPAESRTLKAHIPPEARLADGILQGITDFHRSGYGGPCPPSGTHRYFFKLYALDTTLELSDKTTKADLERAMEGHVLAKSELTGTYARSR